MADKIGLIAGSGQFPILFAKAAREKGLQIYAAAYKEEADPALDEYTAALEWLYLGQLNRLIKFFHRHRVSQAVMMGAVRKTRMFSNVRPDIRALALFSKLRHTHDDALLREFADLLEKEGIQIKPSTMLLPDLLAPPGVWTRRKPSKAEKRDIDIGWRIAKEIGRLDIGQCVVIKNGSILAVEAIDGTDATIERAGRLGGGHAVVIKVCKPNQDLRFDMPAVGLKTVETLIEAKVAVLAVEAGKTLFFDFKKAVQLADKHKIVVAGITK